VRFSAFLCKATARRARTTCVQQMLPNLPVRYLTHIARLLLLSLQLMRWSASRRGEAKTRTRTRTTAETTQASMSARASMTMSMARHQLRHTVMITTASFLARAAFASASKANLRRLVDALVSSCSAGIYIYIYHRRFVKLIGITHVVSCRLISSLLYLCISNTL
jgi:hypothetical protein